MGDDGKEKFLLNSPLPIPIKGIEIILYQMKKCVCKIYRKDGIKGTGFFCKIPYKNELLPILVTNWHILTLEEINYNKEIKLSLNDDKEFKVIKIDENRKIFSDKDLDATFVEINIKNDKINDFLEIDEDINKNDAFLNEILIKKSIYLLNYQEGNNMFVSFGLINSIKNNEISHSSNSKEGSSGSPIILSNTHKVIGIHTGKNLSDFKFNKGILIKYAIIKFNNIENNISIIENINNTFIHSENDFQKDNILQCLQKLNEKCMNIQNLFELEFNNISQPQDMYLINQKWINMLNNLYNYDSINKSISNDKISLKKSSSININEIFSTKNILFEICKFNRKSYHLKYPTNFEICDITTFNDILQNININYNIKLKIDYIFRVFFGDNKIFIRCSLNHSLFFIYSFINEKYEIEYIIVFNEKKDLYNLIKNNTHYESFEELISNYGINLNEIEPQNIIDNNLNKIGVFLNIKKKKKYHIREPNHCLGLKNIGTYYLNPTIQCLCHLLSMKHNLQNKNLIFNKTNNRNSPLTKEFYILINNLWKYSNDGNNYYNPESFKKKINEMNHIFQDTSENDIEDLIVFLYNTMHNEINNKKKNIQNNSQIKDDLQNFRQKYYSDNSSFIIDTFYFEKKISNLCLKCGYNNISYNVDNTITFSLKKINEYLKTKNHNENVTLNDFFDYYQKKKLIKEPIYCEDCKNAFAHKICNTIITSPEVLTIILSKEAKFIFEYNFDYPLLLNIDNYVMDKSISNNNNYELVGIINHNMYKSCYSFCKSPIDGKWYYYDDTNISPVDESILKNKNQIPYVLFYQKYNNKITKKNSYFYKDLFGKNNVNINDYSKSQIKFENINISNFQNNNFDAITLNFQYNDKIFDLNVGQNNSFNDIIKKLNKTYNIPQNVTLYFQIKTNLITIEKSRTIKDYNLKTGANIIIIDN